MKMLVKHLKGPLKGYIYQHNRTSRWLLRNLSIMPNNQSVFRCDSHLQQPQQSNGRRMLTVTSNFRVCGNDIVNGSVNQQQGVRLDSSSNRDWQYDEDYGNTRCRWHAYVVFSGALIAGGLTVKALTEDVLADGLSDENTGLDNDTDSLSTEDTRLTLQQAVQQARAMVKRKMVESGCPGLVIAVSVDGKTVWKEGLGYSDIENNIPCKPETVFRIASISKPITMTAVAKLWEKGDIDFDKPVNEYLPDFPQKTWEGKKVDITVRQLVSHLGGIRHYDKDYMTEKKSDGNDKGVTKDEMQLDEYYIRKHFKSITDSLKLFQDDPLVNKPGSKFLYTSHGWTLVSAVLEKAANMTYEKYMKITLDELGLQNTYMEHNAPIVPNRGRHYVQNKQGRIENALYVDLSYKWAGGGFISNVNDITKFGNAMLYSYQASSPKGSPGNNDVHSSKSAASVNGKINIKREDAKSSNRNFRLDINTDSVPYLKPETVKKMWTMVDKTVAGEWSGLTGGGYGLGWRVWHIVNEHAFCKTRPFLVSHTGGAVGASSVLLILPSDSEKKASVNGYKVLEHQGEKEIHDVLAVDGHPRGVVVSIIVNLSSVGLNKTALDIAELFDHVQ